MEFTKLSMFEDLINSEGSILSLVESVDRDEMPNERLYLKGLCLSGRANLYCKVNPFALEMFFQGRISVRELFLLRVDEPYILEYDGKQDVVLSDERFIETIINNLECAYQHFFTLPESMRVNSPFETILHIVNRDYINGLCSVWAHTKIGINPLINNGLVI